MPSQRFGVNSAWLKISLLTYNLVRAIKGLCLEGEERTARSRRRMMRIGKSKYPRARAPRYGDYVTVAGTALGPCPLLSPPV